MGNTASEEGSSEHRSHSIISPKSLESSLTTTPKKNLKPSLSREMESVWSPSVLCGLSTPPCQISPSSSVADLSGSLYSSVPATPTSVNVTTPTQANIFTYGTPWDESRRTPLSKANILTRLTKSLSKSDTPSPPPQSEEIKKSDQSSETSSKYESLITVLERQTDTSKKESFDENIVEEMQMERDELKVKERERKVSVKDLPKLIEGLSKSMEQGQEDDDVNEEISAIVNTPHDTDSENNDVDRSSSTPFKSTTEFLTGPSSFPEKQFYHDPTHDDPQINFCSDSSSQIDDFFRIRSSSDPVSAKSKLFQRRLNKLEQNHSGRSSIERPIPFEKLGLIENAFQDRYFENPAMVDVCVGTDDRPPPPDEINILKGQVQLLHNQLLYERHKRELHAQRNRRLLGKTHKAIAMEEIAATRLDELRCKDKENENMRIEVTKLREENSRLKEFNNNVTKEQQAFLRSHKEDKERLELKSKDHESKLRQQEEEIEELTKELKKTSAELFNVVNELEDLKEKAAMTDLYKAEVSRLKKQLVLMSEFQQKVLEKTKENTKCSNDEKLIIEKNIKEELVCYKDKVQHLTQQISAYTSRISELEATLSNKEMTAAEQKRFLENVKSLSKGQIQAMDGKYKALKKTNQRLEAHILKLYNQLEQRDGGVKVPASQSAMKHRKNSHEHLTKDSPPVSRESPLSSWSASSSVTGGSSVDSVSDGSPVRKNVKFASDASTSLIEPVRPLFNVNSPSITFSSESPFKKFHDTSGTKSSKANTLPKVRGVFEQSSTMARSYPPPGNIDRIVTMETQKLEAKNSEVQKTGQGEKS
uniref:Hamartin-like n=1 Tax=Saccoglossus kowalevskii TaxID=10224 RepID=A0ABM0GQF5_SACKO|nr:PREDICTED: hamartin-like [Saccoglossus kowalevskii]